MNKLENMSHRWGKRIFLLVSSVFLLGTLLSSGACFCAIVERIAPIQIQNNTNQTLSIYIDSTYIGDVAPGEQIKNENPKIWIKSRFNIEAKNVQGEIVYSREFTFEELEDDIDWKVVIPPLENK